MASITIRNLDEDVRSRLKRRAAANNRSMEAEAREILRIAVGRPDLARSWVEAFRQTGGVDLPLPARAATRPVDLE